LAAKRAAYRAAGVDVAAGERAVELMRAAVESTRRPEVLGGLGGFAAAVALPAGLRDPVLISSTDGVGTKTAIAAMVRRFDTIGRDLVAMCADDVVCSGAAPLFFLDYVAVGLLEPSEVAELVGGVAAGCRDAGCALVGGETAEHPGLIDAGAFDLAGCCVGVVERDRIIDATRVRAGDAIIGLASSGLHANGYSLVRALIASWDLDLARPYQEQLVLSLGDAARDEAMAAEPERELATLGDVLLEPSTIYTRLILGLRDALDAAGSELRGVAHITGGALPGNVPRMLPPGLAARLDPTRWPVPSVIRLVAALAGIDDEESRSTFNAGLGMAVVVPRDGVPLAIDAIQSAGTRAWLVGEVVDAGAAGSTRYVEGALEATA
jgi:phosphoribosylformylglycinamidine cyclo-ligase